MGKFRIGDKVVMAGGGTIKVEVTDKRVVTEYKVNSISGWIKEDRLSEAPVYALGDKVSLDAHYSSRPTVKGVYVGPSELGNCVSVAVVGDNRRISEWNKDRTTAGWSE